MSSLQMSSDVRLTTVYMAVSQIIFILESFSKIAAFGFLKYLSDSWNILDFIVVLESLTEFALVIITSLGSILAFNVKSFSSW